MKAEDRSGVTFRMIKNAVGINYDRAKETMDEMVYCGEVEGFETSTRCKECHRITKTSSMSRNVFFIPSTHDHYIKHRSIENAKKNKTDTNETQT